MGSRDSEGGREPLWEFALALYSSPGVEETALFLQDHKDLRVSLLLWLCWLEVRDLRLTPAQLGRAEAAIAAWDDRLAARLRKMRRRLKTAAAQDSRTAALRREIKNLELQAERYLLARLAALEMLCSFESAEGSAPGGNLTVYLRAQGLAIEQDEKLAKGIATLATATAALKKAQIQKAQK